MKIKQYTDLSKINEPKLDQLQYYIYILENIDEYIKIGRTHDIVKRINSLSNSNTGGSKIIRCAISPPTYLRTIETSMHIHFNKYRTEGEWFEKLTFDEALSYLQKAFDSKNYQEVNNLRRDFGGYKGRVAS